MKTKLISALMLLLLSLNVNSQCNAELVQIAMAQSGKDAVFIREFKAKLQKGSTRNPSPSVKYNVFLKENSRYRFNVLSERAQAGTAVLQLFAGAKCVGSTSGGNNSEAGDSFDYVAEKTGTYHVVISFGDGKPGCAAGVMSLIPEPGSTQQLAEAASPSGEPEVLFLQVDNPVSVVTDKEPADSLIMEIDNGSVLERAGTYYLRPENEGFATLKVTIRNKNGHVKEEARSDFIVKRMPFPRASIQGLSGGAISKSSLQMADELQISSPIEFEKYGYRILDFIVKTGDKNEKRFANSGKRFSSTLRAFLADLPDDSKMIIESIHVRKPDGSVITLEPLAFIVR